MSGTITVNNPRFDQKPGNVYITAPIKFFPSITISDSNKYALMSASLSYSSFDGGGTFTTVPPLDFKPANPLDPSGEKLATVNGTDAGLQAFLQNLVFTPDRLDNGKAFTGYLRVLFTDPNVSDNFSTYKQIFYTVVTPPLITGTSALTNVNKPFASVSVADDVYQPGVTAAVPKVKVGAVITETVDSSTTASDTAGKLAGITETTPGTYQLDASDSTTLTNKLNAITFNSVAAGNDQIVHFSIRLTDDPGFVVTDSVTSVKVAANPALITKNFNVNDTSTKNITDVAGVAYVGPVAGLQNEYINITTDNLNVTASTANVFIHTGAGMDGIMVLSGRNVLDGGTGSNFMIGGTGTDTFFVDARNAPSDTWSTVVGAHSGDDITVFGITPQAFAIGFFDNEGAVGSTGLTMHAYSNAGKPPASFTLAGYTMADMASGKVAVVFGANGTEPYMNVRVT